MELEKMGVKELKVEELVEVNGGDRADNALLVMNGVGMVMFGIGLVCTGPVGIAIGIMGASMTWGCSIAGTVKGICGWAGGEDD